jgi:Iodothyronine deiodinase
MADRHRGCVAFLLVYIREAHPEEEWILPENRRSGVAVHEPTTVEERLEVASTCAAKLHVEMPTVVDELDNAVARAYGGWPDRLYLVGGDGRIAFQGGEGPFGFKPAELERAILGYT